MYGVEVELGAPKLKIKRAYTVKVLPLFMITLSMSREATQVTQQRRSPAKGQGAQRGVKHDFELTFRFLVCKLSTGVRRLPTRRCNDTRTILETPLCDFLLSASSRNTRFTCQRSKFRVSHVYGRSITCSCWEYSDQQNPLMAQAREPGKTTTPGGVTWVISRAELRTAAEGNVHNVSQVA